MLRLAASLVSRSFALLIALGLTSGCAGSQGTEPRDSLADAEASRSRELAAAAAKLGTRYLAPYGAEDLHRGGESGARVTVVAFAAHTPADAELLAHLETLLSESSGDLKVVIKYSPRPDLAFGAQAVIAANAQGKGWAMHSQLLAAVAAHASEGPAIVAEDMRLHAESVGVPDLARFEADYADEAPAKLRADKDLAQRLGVNLTPFMFINGAPYPGLRSLAELREIVAAEREAVAGLVAAGAERDELYSLIMVGAEAERAAQIPNPPPFDGEPLSTTSLASGAVVDEFLRGEGPALSESQVAHFEFTGYESVTARAVMGSRQEPAKLRLSQAARDTDPIAAIMCDALAGMQVGGKRRVRIPAAIANAERPEGRPAVGDLVVYLALVAIEEGPALLGAAGFEGQPLRRETRAGGLEVYDYALGEGPAAKVGMVVETHYVMTLEDGTVLDSSHGRAEGLRATLGETKLIEGFLRGLRGVRAGMRRKLVVPAALAYRDQAQGKIPPNSTLIFMLEVMSVEDPPAKDE